ncbi:sigma54 specific transcriptional regulator, Fis family [Candidatus Koribacter versatilis Ellin345]|uniref:Sigma54 specific transcriptional regulator, Fis family n=1 Tax=Koribacter versatilis (strain Ellin345) TaxID=204669 RepID=Q1IVS2_KORVE|nr:sigma-54 dependent transcriptional regulator [Candidatus Koribacter versatilis]ABF39028.1 sigma54 specific transcriptional regulator, Fis family [Candidatus Koribacter versatilis Ellin345]
MSEQGAASAKAAESSALSAYVAVDAASKRLVEQIKRVAQSAATVLVRGENGVGKDLVASLLHYLGPNRDEPMVKIDCASLPHELIESELFGYEKGAFTGATHQKRGRLELAGNGTLILDEIAALTMPMQAKLLRVIEQKEFERLGGEKTIKVHARILALTNVDLERAVARRSFREDLYYRLSVIPLVVPPLRERRDDIQPLAEHFLSQLAQVHRRPKPVFTAGALEALLSFSYPGNVRQLRNILERVVVMSTGPEIHEDDLPSFVRQATGRPMMTLEELERSYIAEVLDATRGKKSKAAEILGISRKTLLEKRKRYGLD